MNLFYQNKLRLLTGGILALCIPLFRLDVAFANLITETVQRLETRGLTIEEIHGESVTLNGKSAQVGEILKVGDQINTGQNTVVNLRVDSYIGLVEVAENTTVEVKTLAGEVGINPNQITVLSVTAGQVRLSVSRFVSSPFWSETIPENQRQTSVTNSPFRIETPTTIIGVRGTTFGVNVSPDGKTAIHTIEGTVGVVNAGEEVRLEKGQVAIVNSAEKPTPIDNIPPISQLRVRSLTRLGLETVQLRGTVDPMDLVYINNQPIQTDAEGNFDFIGRLPVSQRLQVTVRGPSVRERFYVIAVP
ncbi:fecR family protein [Lyngbya aestuarii BL J]|uniref:FecR family protein n=2 Tax=Lyngbya aestuarii TaxID=118322 RepID=U7QGR6_9CYAN|nr:fecR family protein [Lyngbya aestuarii BL J]